MNILLLTPPKHSSCSSHREYEAADLFFWCQPAQKRVGVKHGGTWACPCDSDCILTDFSAPRNTGSVERPQSMQSPNSPGMWVPPLIPDSRVGRVGEKVSPVGEMFGPVSQNGTVVPLFEHSRKYVTHSE